MILLATRERKNNKEFLELVNTYFPLHPIIIDDRGLIGKQVFRPSEDSGLYFQRRIPSEKEREKFIKIAKDAGFEFFEPQELTDSEQQLLNFNKSSKNMSPDQRKIINILIAKDEINKDFSGHYTIPPRGWQLFFKFFTPGADKYLSEIEVQHTQRPMYFIDKNGNWEKINFIKI